VLALSAPSADLFWDSNGNAAGAGATPTGIWGTDLFWNDTADGTGILGAWSDGSTAFFAAGTDGLGPYSVTLSASQTATSLLFEEGAVTLSGIGPTTNLTLSSFIDVALGASGILSVPVAGTAGTDLRNGAGTLSLAAANTYSGSTVVNQGVLAISTDGSLGAIPGAFTGNSLALSNGTTLRFPAAAIVTLNANRGVTLENGASVSIDMPTSGGNFLHAGYNRRPRGNYYEDRSC
jgi:autotransporter-associated beta strand protein